VSPNTTNEGKIIATTTDLSGGGTIKAVVTAGLYDNVTLYDNVVAGNVSIGQNFATNLATSPFFTLTSVNDGIGNIDLTLTRVAFGLVPMGGNAPAVGGGIDNIYDGIDPNSPFGDLVGSIFGMDQGGADKFLNQLSGSEHAQVQQVSLNLPELITGAIEQRLHNKRGTGNGTQSAMAPLNINQLAYNAAGDGSDAGLQLSQAQMPQPKGAGVKTAWLAGIGNLANADGNAFGPGFDQATGGVLAGLDYGLSDQITLGVAGGYSHTSVDFNGGTGDTNSIDSFHVAGYGSWDTGSLYVDGVLQYEHNSYDSVRNVAAESLKGSYSGNVFGAHGEIGYALKFAPVTLTPQAGISYVHASIGGFTETGGAAALSVDGVDADSLTSMIGARLSAQFTVGHDTVLRPELRAFWRHEYLDDRQQIGAAFVAAPGSNFTALGSTFGRDTGIVGVGLTATMSPSLDLFVDYDAQFSSDITSNAIQGGARLKF
jgi:outer membrane autotransporter protein